MFSEVLKIKPELDNASASKMESSLVSRFTNISKKFGKGLGSALLGGGLTGLALGVLEKILNPLKETKEAIERMLDQSDSLSTNAKQFNTTSGKLFKLQQFGKASGLDPSDLFMMIEKFQTAVTEAKVDPTKPTAVRNFVDTKDTAEGFFAFIQALKALPKDAQVFAQQEVFGEKAILKMSSFLNQNFTKAQLEMHLKDSEFYTPKIESLAERKNQLDTERAGFGAADLVRKARLIDEGVISRTSGAEARGMLDENRNLSHHATLSSADEAATKMQATLTEGVTQLTALVTNLTGLNQMISNFSVGSMSRLFRGATPKGKGE